jgi:basic membrane protein A
MGDNGFTDYTVAGIDRIKTDFKADTKVIENNNDSSKFSQSLEAAFQWQPDVVFADAYGFEELYAQYADKYPDVKVINLDFVVENSKKTITSVTYINEEGSFLAGVLAALVTTSDLEKANAEKKVGFVGGNDIPVIRQFEYGFIQGVKYVDPSIEVVSSFVGDFFDPIKGKQAAQQMYAQGVDIIFQAAGQTGAGILEASKESNKYAIGVDSNQNGVFPGHIPASMVKDLNNTVYNIYKSIQDGTYESGKHIEMGAGIGGVYLAIDKNSEAILDKEMIDTVKSLETKINAGEIVVERYK